MPRAVVRLLLSNKSAKIIRGSHFVVAAATRPKLPLGSSEHHEAPPDPRAAPRFRGAAGTRGQTGNTHMGKNASKGKHQIKSHRVKYNTNTQFSH